MSSPGPSEPDNVPAEFHTWKLRLRKDCELQDKLVAFEALGDFVLRLLWENGVEPSVEGIMGSRSADPNPIGPGTSQ